MPPLLQRSVLPSLLPYTHRQTRGLRMQRPYAAVIVYETPLADSVEGEYLQVLLQLTSALFHTVSRCGNGFPQLMLIEISPTPSEGGSRIVYSSRDVEQRTSSAPAVLRLVKESFLDHTAVIQSTRSRCAALRALLQGSCFLTSLGSEAGLSSLCVVVSPTAPALVEDSATSKPLSEADQAVVSSLAHTWCSAGSTVRLCVGGRLAAMRSLKVLAELTSGTVHSTPDEAAKSALGLGSNLADARFTPSVGAPGLGASLSSGQVMVCPKCLCWAPWPSEQKQCSRCESTIR